MSRLGDDGRSRRLLALLRSPGECHVPVRSRLPALARSRAAGRRRGSRRRSATPRARVPRRVGRGDRRQRRPRPGVDRPRPGRAGRAPVVRPRSALHDAAASRTTPRAVGRHLPIDGAGDLPGQRRLGGDRDRAEARPRLPPRPRRGRPLDRHRALGELPRQHARRAGPVGPAPLRRPYEGWLGRFRARLGGLPVSRRRARTPTPSATPTSWPRSWTASSRRPAPGTRRRVRRGADRRGDARRASSRPTATGRRSRRSAGATASCSIADEVMTGFGRTGRWFGLDHWGVRPDILVAAKGASSGYWPFGFVAASGASTTR